MKIHSIGALVFSVFLASCAQVNIADLNPDDFGGGGGGSVSFENDVLPVFSTSCGACHIEEGVLNGGLVLVPKSSGSALTPDDLYTNTQGSVNTTDPEASDILTVPSTGELPGSGSHTGGVALASTSDGYKTILKWIQEGAANN